MKQRIATALIGIPFVLAAVFVSNPWPMGLLLLAAGAIAAFEYFNLIPNPSDQKGKAFAAACFLGLMLIGAIMRPSLDTLRTAYLAFGVGLIAAFPEAPSSARSFGVLYIMGGILSMMGLHNMFLAHNEGIIGWQSPLLMALLPVWAGDTAAIFAGKAFGKHKLAPNISPSKTWEGGIANLLACIATAAALAPALNLNWSIGVLCGIACGVLGQAGDLYESWLKRKADVKDSGNILPGHGGVLDRIDSLLFSAIAVYALLVFLPNVYQQAK